MYLALTDEQSFLQEAAAEALRRHTTLEQARGALDGTPLPDLFAVAADAGWTGLLTAEEADGVGLGVYEALLVLEACGRHLADARLLGHLPAAALLELGAADVALRGALARGERRAALVDAELGERGSVLVTERDGDGGAPSVSGIVRGVLDAAGADVLVVAEGDVVLVVDPDQPGLTVTARDAYDATRVLADVALDDVRGTRVAVPADRLRDGRDLQRALLAAEAVGSAHACLDMARAYAVDRVAFGRPIGSYQAIKHKLVEMLRRIEGARSLLVAAGDAWGAERFAVLASAARVTAADALDHAAPENIFIHGGVGATWEHDAQLFYRRAELGRRLAGGVDAAALVVADGLLATAA